MDYLKSIGIYDKKSYKHWVVKNHPDRNSNGTELFIKVCRLYEQFIENPTVVVAPTVTKAPTVVKTPTVFKTPTVIKKTTTVTTTFQTTPVTTSQIQEHFEHHKILLKQHEHLCKQHKILFEQHFKEHQRFVKQHMK